MAGLCEGSNEPPGSLKASKLFKVQGSCILSRHSRCAVRGQRSVKGVGIEGKLGRVSTEFTAKTNPFPDNSLDKPNNRTSLMMEFLQEEGFTLVNKKDNITYMAPNGASTIDLVFYRGKNIKVCGQEILYHSNESPLRKHLPVVTVFQISRTETDNARNVQTESTRTRRLNQTFLQQRTATLEIATDQINREEIEDALETVVEYIREAQIKQRKRIAKPWFDRECYDQRKEALNQLHTAKQSRTKEALRLYSEKRKDYKRIIKEKKNNYIEEQAKKQAEEAQKNPFAAQKQISKVSAAGIQIATWKQHFTSLLNKNQAEEAYPNNQTEEVTSNQ
ncbi:hypothetical protein ANN_27209 [Periplaneta americana]|uniref:Uncharacterized protein n=1 Tax=Periplaneta americana TaxID=6978 RepID=A0ABQ8RXN3_PERAM|nr:hypothetical protein ANN_27209 [Periplaneta americana]